MTDPIAPVSEWLIQATSIAPTREEAEIILGGYTRLEGYRGGRVVDHSTHGRPQWLIQAFYSDPHPYDSWRRPETLPDGMRRVLVPPGLRRSLGITERA